MILDWMKYNNVNYDDTKKTALDQDEWRYIGDLTDR